MAGATPLAEGSVRRSGECVFTPRPNRLRGCSRTSNPSREGVEDDRSDLRWWVAVSHQRVLATDYSFASVHGPAGCCDWSQGIQPVGMSPQHGTDPEADDPARHVKLPIAAFFVLFLELKHPRRVEVVGDYGDRGPHEVI